MQQYAETVRVPRDAVMLAADHLATTNWREHGTKTIARCVLFALLSAGYRIERPQRIDGEATP